MFCQVHISVFYRNNEDMLRFVSINVNVTNTLTQDHANKMLPNKVEVF